MSEKGTILLMRQSGFLSVGTPFQPIVFDIIKPGPTKITVNSTTNPVSGRFNNAVASPLSSGMTVSFSDWHNGELKTGRAMEMVHLLRDVARAARPVTIGTTRETVTNVIISTEDIPDPESEEIEEIVITYTKIDFDIIEQRAANIDENLRHAARTRAAARPPKKPVKPATPEEARKGSVAVNGFIDAGILEALPNG